MALEAIKERQTTQELAAKFEVHSTQITKWKREFLKNASAAFETKSRTDNDDLEKEKLYGKIGQLQVENDFLKHVLEK